MSYYYDLMIENHTFDSSGNYCGQRRSLNYGCDRCGDTEDNIKDVNGPGCWYNLCRVCRQEEQEINRAVAVIVKKYDAMRSKRNEHGDQS
jgi:hypothetical protein